MKLHDKMINNGKLFFKYRGQFPLLLLFGSTIIMYNSDCYQGPENTKNTDCSGPTAHEKQTKI